MANQCTSYDINAGTRCQKDAAGATDFPYVCSDHLPGVRAWKTRSDRAKRAVATKRQKYTKWPTRNRDHKAR